MSVQRRPDDRWRPRERPLHLVDAAWIEGPRLDGGVGPVELPSGPDMRAGATAFALLCGFVAGFILGALALALALLP